MLNYIRHRKDTVKLPEICSQIVKKMFNDDNVFVYRMNDLCQTNFYYLTFKIVKLFIF